MSGFNAKLVRIVRIHKGMSQQALAERLGLTQNNVSVFENSESLAERTVDRIAAAMGFTIAEFYTFGIRMLEKEQ